jgi:hypothetical protein
MAAVSILVLNAGGAAAQQSALTVLPEEPPLTALYRLGPVLVNATVAVPEIGGDSNAFNESTTPKEDFVIKMTPEVDFFTEAGVFRVAVKSASTFTYFHRYESERSIAEQVRGRVTARFSRFRPWVGGASLRSNERTSEIDVRAKRVDQEVAAGLQFDVSPLATVTAAANRVNVRFDDAAYYTDERLAEALDRTMETAALELRFEATPLTALTFRGYVSRDVFARSPSRNSRAQGGEVEVNFGPEAVVRGRLALGFRHQDAEDPTLETYRGLSGRGGISTVLLWRAILGVDYVREVQYSVNRIAGYYVESGGDLVYTQRVSGPFDLQARVGRHTLDYSARVSTPARTEVLNTYQGGIGYSLDNGSRFGLSYEYAQRVDEPAVGRGFTRRRVFGSFTYEFWK